MANKSQTLDAPLVPTLPQPSNRYEQGIATQHNGLLRTFFLKVQSAMARVLGPNGGQYIDCPNGLFFNTSTQTIASANTAYPVEFPSTYLGNGVEVNAGTDSRIYVSISGIYNFQFSGQIKSASSSSKQIYLWITRNGTDIGYSTHQYTLSGSNVHMCVEWNFNIDMQAGDYIELEWSASDNNVVMEATAATSPHPGVPSAVMAVNFIAPLPDVIPTPP